MKTHLFLFVALITMAGCAHHRDVRPSDDGVHRVVVRSEDTEAGSREAIEQANHFCKQSNQYAAFVKEDNKYTGDMDEQSYKNAKRVSKAVQAVGGMTGGMVGMGGAVADDALGEGYTTEMKFRCK